MLPQDGMATVAYEGSHENTLCASAELCHCGTYSCKTNNDAISFHVEIKGDLMFSFMETPHEMCVNWANQAISFIAMYCGY